MRNGGAGVRSAGPLGRHRLPILPGLQLYLTTATAESQPPPPTAHTHTADCRRTWAGPGAARCRQHDAVRRRARAGLGQRGGAQPAGAGARRVAGPGGPPASGGLSHTGCCFESAYPCCTIALRVALYARLPCACPCMHRASAPAPCLCATGCSPSQTARLAPRPLHCAGLAFRRPMCEHEFCKNDKRRRSRAGSAGREAQASIHRTEESESQKAAESGQIGAAHAVRTRPHAAMQKLCSPRVMTACAAFLAAAGPA